MAKSREEILGDLRRLRKHCKRTIAIAEAYNRRCPGLNLEPDPGGRLARIIATVDRVLAADPGYGPIASLDGMWDGESDAVH